MMTPEQVKNVTHVYNKFMNSEKRGWDELDNCLELLEFIDDDQLHREASVMYDKHRHGASCHVDHPESDCFVPHIIEAISAILELYMDTGNMHKNNRYILQYYLALSQAEMILPDGKKNDSGAW